MRDSTQEPTDLENRSLSGKQLFLATPMYGGVACSHYLTSVLGLQSLCYRLELPFTHYFVINESLITRARNRLVWQFRHHATFSHLLFVDADISFDPEDVVRMLLMEKDVIAAPYSKKQINWEAVVERARCDLDASPTDVEEMVSEYVFTPLDPPHTNAEVVRVAEAGTGMMLVHRDVFRRLDQAYPNDVYISDEAADVRAGVRRRLSAHFDCGISRGRYLSEDYMFCRKWRDIGGDIWLYTRARTRHFGTYNFGGRARSAKPRPVAETIR